MSVVGVRTDRTWIKRRRRNISIAHIKHTPSNQQLNRIPSLLVPTHKPFGIDVAVRIDPLRLIHTRTHPSPDGRTYPGLSRPGTEVSSPCGGGGSSAIGRGSSTVIFPRVSMPVRLVRII